MAKTEGPAFPRNPFWDFSLATYARSGVARACLALQDRHGLDVNVVLLCCWMGASGRGVVEQPALAAALDTVRPWQEGVVAPLRRVRRHLKTTDTPAPATTVAALRRRVGDAELDAEHVEQLALAAAVPGAPDEARPPRQRLGDAAHSVALYLEVAGVRPDAQDCGHLVAVLAGAFPEFGPGEAARALGLSPGGRG